MAIEKGWDWLTLFLYIFISVFIALMFKYSIRVKNEEKTIKIFNKKISQKYLYYLVIYRNITCYKIKHLLKMALRY